MTDESEQNEPVEDARGVEQEGAVAADATHAESGTAAAAADGADRADEEDGSSAAGTAVEVRRLQEELSALNDRHLRLAAEFDNYRKRNERDRQTLVSRLQADLVGALLDVLDDLDRVAESAPDTSADSVLEGVRLVQKKFVGVLEGAGLEPVDADGAPFDPELMEALMMVPTDDPAKDHHVADVFQRGYRFRGTLIRPARVRVHEFDEGE